MEENNIIICENCYEENENTRTTCKKCGAKLYNNNNEIVIKKETNTEKIEKNHIEETEYFEDKNKVALIIKIIAIVGAIVGIIYGCILFDSSYTETLGVVYIVVSIISAVFVYALGEIIQLLEDIKNK